MLRMEFGLQVAAVAATAVVMGCARCPDGTGARNDDWASSEWISVPSAPTFDGEVKEGCRAADGTSWFAVTFTNEAEVVSARWRVTGLGVFDVFVNGRSVGTDFLKPGFTHFAKTKYAFEYDVTGLIRTGCGEANVLAAEVSAGWWRDKVVSPNGKRGFAGRKSAFRGVLELTYADGSQRVVPSNVRDWTCGTAGPVKRASIFDGEEYDARVVSPRFGEGLSERPERNDEFRGEILPSPGAEIALREDLTLKPKRAYAWKGVADATEDAWGKVGNVRELPPVGSFVLRRGETLVVDFGQNAAAVPSFGFSAKRGVILTALPAEMLNDRNGDKGRGNDGPEGSVYRANLRNIPVDGARVVYTFAGTGRETYRPRFTYFGYRYLSVTATDDVAFESVVSVPVSSVTREMESGSIETGDGDLNRFISNVRWGQLSNYLSVPTDCPQRGERLGWTADTQVFAEAGSFLADTRRFFRKWMRDMRDSVNEHGSFPGVAPTAQFGDDMMRLGWADAGVIVPWTVWRQFGETSIIDDNWEAMVKFVDHVAETKYRHETIVSECLDSQWADWLSYEDYETWSGRGFLNNDRKSGKVRPETYDYWDYLGGCYWLYDAQLMRDMALATGRDATKYEKMAAEAESYLKGRFFASPDGLILPVLRKMQTPAVFALKFGLVAGEAKARTLEGLVKNIADHGDCLQTGFLGTSFLMDVLSGNGAADVAYTLLLQHRNPSWLYSVDQGATTVWERWNSYTIDRGFGPVAMNSFNHYAYGAVLAWIFRNAAGIACDPATPGFRRIVMRPIPDRRLGHVSATYDSAAGRIASAWKYEGDRWSWTFTVPEGAVAVVTLPGERDAKQYGPGTYEVSKDLRDGGSPYRELVPLPQKIRIGQTCVDVGILDSVTVRTAEIADAPKNVSDEAYALTVGEGGVTIEASTDKGVRYAKTTLSQLAKLADGGRLATGRIVDWPRLKWRGYMPDTARNYLDLKSMKAMIDMMAAYKLNLLHWHLTEHYGWRLESKLYPELRSEKAFLNRHPGKYYTQDEFREIVDYAWERGIVTMPELDVPGHATAFRHAFGFKNMDNPKATKIIEDLFRELCTLTSVEKMPFVHIGTDEVWNKEVEGAKPESIARWAKAVTDSGRWVVSWDPGQAYESTRRISMLWEGNPSLSGGGRPSFDANQMYIETFDPFELLPHGAYQKQFVSGTAEEKQLGAVFCGWHDGFAGEKYETVFRNQPVFPACVVFGDNFWSDRERDWPQYRDRLPLADDPLLTKAAELERRVIAQRDRVLKDLAYPFHFVGQTQMRWRLTNEKGEVIATDIAQATISPRKDPNAPGNFTEVTNGTMIAETWIRSPKDQTVGAWIGFTGMDRDHGITRNAPTPKRGEWNGFGAFAELNGERIPPPDWQRPGIEKGAKLTWCPVPWWYESDEEPFTDQEYFMREPTPITLKEGWNHVRLVAPCPGKKVGTFFRHWIMTFCPVMGSTDHPREVPDLVYSSEPPSYVASWNDRRLELQDARISSIPYCRVWPGHQRDKAQTELSHFVRFDVAAGGRLTVSGNGIGKSLRRILPLSFDESSVERTTDAIGIDISKPGFLVLEFEGRPTLHVFADPPLAPIPAPGPGGRTIRFPRGEHHPGVVAPHSGDVVILDEGAVVYGALFILNATNVTVTGRGIFDGSRLERSDKTMRKFRRERGLPEIDTESACFAYSVYGSENVTISGVTFRDPPFWTLVVRNQCRNTLIDNIHIVGNWRYNSDGVDVCASADTVIRNSFFRTCDDCVIARGPYMKGEHAPVSGMIVTNCSMYCDWGVPFKAQVQDFHGSTIEDVTMRDCKILSMRENAIFLAVRYGSDLNILRRMAFEDIELDFFPQMRSHIQDSDDAVFVAEPLRTNSLVVACSYTLGKNLDNQVNGKMEDPSYYKFCFEDFAFRNFKALGENRHLDVRLETKVPRHEIRNVKIEGLPAHRLVRVGNVFMSDDGR